MCAAHTSSELNICWMAEVFQWLYAQKKIHELWVCFIWFHLVLFPTRSLQRAPSTLLIISLCAISIIYSFVLSRTKFNVDVVVAIVLCCCSAYCSSLCSRSLASYTQLTPMVLAVIIFHLIFLISDVGFRSYEQRFSLWMCTAHCMPHVLYSSNNTRTHPRTFTCEL